MIWKSLLLCALVAHASSDPLNKGAWTLNSEYRYELNTQTLASMPNLKNQWVGLFTKAQLTIRPHSEDVLIATISNGQSGEWHGQLPKGKYDSYPSVLDSELNYEPMQMSSKPFELRLKNGAIDKIAVDESLSNVELNQLKAIVSQLQVDVRAENLIDSNDNQLPRGDNAQAVYKVMEPTVTGNCETLYDITPMPEHLLVQKDEHILLKAYENLSQGQQLFEVVKTKNYSSCEQRMGYHFGVQGINGWKPNTQQMGGLQKSAVSRIYISGTYDKHTILQSVTTNRIVNSNADVKDKRDAMVVSKVNLTLINLDDSTPTQVYSEARPQQLTEVDSLVYSYNDASASKLLRYGAGNNEEQYNEEQYNGEYADELKSNRRYTRSVNRRMNGNAQRDNENDWYSSNDFQLNSDDENQEYYQPEPELSSAPRDPLLPYFVGRNGKPIQNAQVVERCIQLTREVAAGIQDPSEIPHKNVLTKFNILVGLIRTMNANQIKELSQSLGNQESTGKIYRDAAVEAGSAPSVLDVMQSIEEGRIEGEEAIQLIAALPRTIREPTEKLQQRFFNFATSQAIQRDADIVGAAWVALAEFLNQAQVNNRSAYNYYPVQSYGRLSERDSKFVLEKVIPYFANQLKQSVQQKQAQKALYAIRALGNLGHREILNVFEPYLEGQASYHQVSDFQRLAMIVALDKYTETYKREAQTVLFKVYQNKGETHQIRTAALFRLMRTSPSASLLQRLAEQANQEENPHIRSAVRYALQTAAQLTTDENKVLAVNARAAINLLKPADKQNVKFSRTYLLDYALEHLDAVYEQQTSYIGGKHKILPDAFFTDVISGMNGFKKHSEYQAMVSNIENLCAVFSEHLETSKPEHQNNKYESIKSTYVRLADKIRSLFGKESHDSKPLEAQILTSFLNTKRFFTFDKQSIENMPKMVKSWVKSLRNGHQINYSKLYRSEVVMIAFPLESGLPFVYKHSTPTLMSVNGQIKAQFYPSIDDSEYDGVKIPRTVNVTADIEVVYSTQLNKRVGFFNPLTHKQYEAGYVKKAQVYVPIKVKTDIDLENGSIETEIEPLNKNGKATRLIHMSSWPYTALRDILAQDSTYESDSTKLIHTVANVRTERKPFGERFIGRALTIENKFEKDSHNYGFMSALHRVYNLFTMSMTHIHQSKSSVEHQQMEIFYDANESSCRSVKFAAKYDTVTPNGQERITSQQYAQKHVRLGKESQQRNIDQTNVIQSREQHLQDVSVDGGIVHVLDMDLLLNGQHQIKYATSLAYGEGVVKRESRGLVYWRHSSSNPLWKMDRAVAIHMQMKSNEQQWNAQYNQQMNGEEKKSTVADIHINLEDKNTQLSGDLYASVEFPHENQRDHMHAEISLEKMPYQGRLFVHTVLNKIANSLKQYYPFAAFKTQFDFYPTEEMSKVRLSVRSALVDLYNSVQASKVCSIGDHQFITFGKNLHNHGGFGKTWHLALHTPQLYRTHWGRNVFQQWSHQPEVSVLVRDYQGEQNGNSYYQNQQQNQYQSQNQYENQYANEYRGDEQLYIGNNNAGSKHEVLIVLRETDNAVNAIRIAPKSGSSQTPRVYVNDEEKQPTYQQDVLVQSAEQSKPLARIYVTEANQLIVEILNGRYQVAYNGIINIKRMNIVSATYGICGVPSHFMTTPAKCLVRDVKQYIASWALIDQESQNSPAAKLQEIINQAKCIKERTYFGNVIDNNSYGYESRQAQCATKHQTQYVRNGSQLCFTTRPLPACSSECKSNGKKEMSHVAVYCRDAADPAAQLYKQKIENGHSLDMSSHQPNNQLRFNVPKQCVRRH